MGTTPERFATVVERVIIDSPEGEARAVVYKKPKRRKKGSPGLRVLGKVLRSMLAAQRDFGAAYEAAHDKSNLAKKDGWLRDLPANLDKAGRKALRKLLKKL